MKCIICYQDADVLYEGTSFCKQHFELHWDYLREGVSAGSLKNMKPSNYEKRKEQRGENPPRIF